MAEDLKIKIKDKYIEGWLSSHFTAGIERFPRAFSVEVTEPAFNQSNFAGIFEPAMPCEIYLGTDKVLTGYIDSCERMVSGHEHSVQICGRSMCEDLMDCSAELYFPGTTTPRSQMMASTPFSIAKELIDPYGISVKLKTKEGAPNIQVPTFSLNLGETAYQVIERVARYSGLLVYDDPDGNLVLSSVAIEPKAKGKLQQGVNILRAHSSYNASDRYSQYEFYTQSAVQTVDQQAAIGKPVDSSVTHGVAKDAFFNKYKTPYGKPRNRKLIQLGDISADASGLKVTMQLRADWECNRRMGRSQRVNLTTTSWRDEGGKLWVPNSLVDFTMPSVGFSNKTWIIADVSFNKSNQGTTADLTLMPQEAFAIEPFNIAPQQADALQAIQDSKGQSAYNAAIKAGA